MRWLSAGERLDVRGVRFGRSVWHWLALESTKIAERVRVAMNIADAATVLPMLEGVTLEGTMRSGGQR